MIILKTFERDSLKYHRFDISNCLTTHWIIYLLTVMFCTDLYANCRTYILYLPHLRIILEILENQCRHLTHFT